MANGIILAFRRIGRRGVSAWRPSSCSGPWLRSPAPARQLGITSPRMSIGLPWLQCGSSTLFSASIDSADKLRQFAAHGDQGVGGEHARSAGVGDDGQARAQARLLRQHLGHVEQVGNGVDAARRSGGTPRRARRRCGERRYAGGGNGNRGAPRSRDDRRSARPRARRNERARIADGFHVNHDAVRVRIVAGKLIRSPQSGEHGADGDAGAETDVFAELRRARQ